MNHDSWTCLLVQRGPGILPDDVCTALKAAACDLQLKRWDRMHIVSDIADGVIATDWQTYAVGGRSGVLFRAQLDSETGTDYQVNFLLNEEDLKRGAKALREAIEESGADWRRVPGRIPVEELYRFYDLRAAGARRH